MTAINRGHHTHKLMYKLRDRLIIEVVRIYDFQRDFRMHNPGHMKPPFDSDSIGL